MPCQAPSRYWGLLAITVRGETDANLQASHGVLLVDPTSLALLDSLALPPPLGHAGVSTSSLDGDWLYMGISNFLFIYSLSAGRVLKAVPRPAHGALVRSPDGTMLVLSDPGLWPGYSGSGNLFIYDPELNLQGVVALPPDSQSGLPVATSRMIFSKDGRWLFVGAGTAPSGPTFGSQRSYVHVIEARTMRLHKSIPLDDWGSAVMFPLR